LPLRGIARSAVSTIVTLSMVASHISPALCAAPMTRAEYEACQAGDEEGFRRAVEAITVKALEEGTKGFDYLGAVTEQWRQLGLDEVLDKRVDLAVDEVRAETSWSSLFKSLASKEKAQELATTVTERVYRSEAINSAIEQLATGVGKEVGKRIELAAHDAAAPALECLRAFVGPRYGATVAGVVSGDAERDFGVDATTGGAEISSGAVLRQSGEGIAGAAVLLIRRQLANMASRLGQRLVGSVLARLVSVVAGGIGLVLIAKDLWDLRNGVLPIIAEEMKAQATKDKVKAELASSIAEQIGDHLKDIAAKSAARVVEIWQNFRSAHMKALELAEHHEGFKSFLDTVPPGSLARLDEVTGLVLGAEGEAGILKRLDDGTLNEAVKSLSEPAMDIARETRSLDAALKWSELADDQLPKVVEYGLYRRASPDDFTKASLARVFALDDPLAIARLATVKREARDVLFDLDSTKLKTLARSLTEAELATLAGYLTGLEKGPRERVLDAVAAQPGKMRVLASERVRDAVIASADQGAAVEMMLRSQGASAATIVADFRSAWQGRVSPILLWDKHPMAIGVLALLVIVLLLMLRRLLLPRRRGSFGAQSS
jgi:hypothetical protein